MSTSKEIGGKKKMREKQLGMMLVVIAALIVISTAAFALPTIGYVKINGDIHESGDNLVVQRGDTLNIKVKMIGVENETNLEAQADLLGYEYSDIDAISDSTHIFDIDSGDTLYKTLSISIPYTAEKDEYDLRLRVAGRTGASFEGLYSIHLESARHDVRIRDVVFSPEGEVVSGRALLAVMRLKNYGEKDEDSIKVRVSIPALGISASDYIDQLDAEESITSEELYLRIPACTNPGIYTVKAEAAFDEGTEVAEKETSIKIVEGESCEVKTTPTQQQPKTIITVGTTNQDVSAGQGGAIYPVSLSNEGTQSKAYTLTVDGIQGWATVKITPANTVVVGPGETKSVYIYLSADESASGERMFSVAVNSEGTPVKEIPLKANVVSAPGDNGEGNTAGYAFGWDKVKKSLEVGLIILVVLLVILALIVGLNKLRGDKDDDEGQTYY